jgi:hypothetical protein
MPVLIEAIRMNTRVRPRTALSLLIVLGIVLVGAIPESRRALLRSAGWALVQRDAEEPADIIVIAVDADGAGVLEAADLVQRGRAARVALFAGTPSAADLEFARRGVQGSGAAAVSRQQLQALGVTAIEQVPQAVAGTDDESEALPQWCDQNGFRTILFVSTRDHSRRVRRILGRTMAGHRTRVLVRYSSYSQFDPDTWWLTRSGVRTELVEFEKLVFDFLRHPF